jgi:hypothetical protein
MSEIRATTISNLAGTGPATLTGQYAAKSWVNLNGTGTVAIRDSENVASLTDNGTGEYTVNFTNAMANQNYSPNGDGEHHSGVVLGYAGFVGAVLETSFRISSINVNGIFFDNGLITGSVHGDLA